MDRRTMHNNDRAVVALAIVAANVAAYIGVTLSAQTGELLARCKQGPDPASCELRLLGR